MSGIYHAKISENYIAVPPGTTIEEQLEIYGITKQEFTEKMDMPGRFIDDLIDGNVPLTNKIAAKLYLKVGFSYEGIMRNAGKKDGKYVDLHLMSMLRDEYFAKKSR